MKKLSYLIILGAIVTACNRTQPKASIQEKPEIIMAVDTCINDTTAFKWFENDSTYTFVLQIQTRQLAEGGIMLMKKTLLQTLFLPF